ncbi:unnamed protein product [Ixodes persulcatus]
MTQSLNVIRRAFSSFNETKVCFRLLKTFEFMCHESAMRKSSTNTQTRILSWRLTHNSVSNCSPTGKKKRAAINNEIFVVNYTTENALGYVATCGTSRVTKRSKHY